MTNKSLLEELLSSKDGSSGPLGMKEFKEIKDMYEQAQKIDLRKLALTMALQHAVGNSVDAKTVVQNSKLFEDYISKGLKDKES